MPTRIKDEPDWYKRCTLIFEYHRSKSRNTKRPKKWKLADTAIALDLSVGYVSESIKIVERISKSECSSRNEALRKIR